MEKIFNTKRFLLYAAKWQLGAIVVVPCMYLFVEKYHFNYVLSTFLMQIVGALVFYPIDYYLFSKTK